MSVLSGIVAMAGWGMPGTPELVIVGLIALVIFGPKRLPALARSVGKSITFSPAIAVAMRFAFGYKLFKDPGLSRDNVYDLLFDLEMPIKLAKLLYLTPGSHMAWTNLSGGTKAARGYMIWLSLNLGLRL